MIYKNKHYRIEIGKSRIRTADASLWAYLMPTSVYRIVNIDNGMVESEGTVLPLVIAQADQASQMLLQQESVEVVNTTAAANSSNVVELPIGTRTFEPTNKPA